MNKKYVYIAAALAAIVLIIALACIAGNPNGEAKNPSETTAPAATGSIPVVSLDGECLNDYTNWNDKSTYYPATLTFTDGDRSFTMEIEIKPQGTSSLGAPKKNFTVKFAEGVEFVDQWGEQKKYVLKADYIDPTCSGNVVSAKLAAEMNEKYGVLVDTPNYGVIDGFPIWVKINGEDAGIFNLTIPKDAWLFGMDEDDPNHLVLACEGWSEASAMKTAEIDYEKDWSFEVGEDNEVNRAAFERLVTFVRDFDQYLDLDACLNYICYVNAAYGVDNVCKNMLMATYDGKVWYPALYDLDSLWGITWDGTGVVNDGVWTEEMLTLGNALLYRVNYYFGDQVRERYQELREGILSKEHIMETFAAYTAQIPQEYYDINNTLWYSDGTRIRTLDLMSQLMDEYLPIMDEIMMNTSSAVTPPSAGTTAGDQGVALDAPLVHYVWENNGVQHSLEDIEALPVAATLSYTLDGQAISAEELTGKSGKVEATLRVEHKADVEGIFGVAAVVQLEEAQCKDLTVTGGTCTVSAEKNVDVCMGTAWLGQTDNVYEMHLSMDVTDFDPAKYVVVIDPVYVSGGNDGSLNALLAAASELTAIVNDGITLHTSLTEWHTYLVNVQNSLTGASALAKTLLPGEEAAQESADAVMKELLAAAEAEADALLKELGYKVAANMTSDERVKLLTQASTDPKNTKEEKEQLSALLERIEGYLIVAEHLERNKQAVAELDSALETLATSMPDIVGAYSYGNDTLYAILYRISTLYQNIANYYASVGGGDAAWVASGDWNDVIIFANHDDIIIP